MTCSTASHCPHHSPPAVPLTYLAGNASASPSRALAMRPRLLICDEPVASLDVSAQAEILELLRQVRQEWEMSMLFITHDLSVVRQMADRIIVLYRGKIVEQGTSETVLDNPRHPYTRRLLAAIPGGPDTGLTI